MNAMSDPGGAPVKKEAGFQNMGRVDHSKCATRESLVLVGFSGGGCGSGGKLFHKREGTTGTAQKVKRGPYIRALTERPARKKRK